MTITKEQNDSKLIIKLEGWLDTTTSPQLGEEIDKLENIKELVLDFDKLEYISSAGLRQVVAASKKAKEMNCDFKIINTCMEVMSVFELTNLDQKFNITAK